jgi:photosystem II stability/assembly factor-like uncharacterized protein
MDEERKKSSGSILDRLTTILFYASIVIFLTAFNFRDNPGGWELQINPNLNGTTIQDVTFTDSLTGYLATGLNNQLGYIFKTTNGGVNWVIKKSNVYYFQRIIFCGKDIGYCNSYDTLFKTTNAGENWFSIPFPFLTFADDMCALNKDTLWFVMSGMFGGIFRSTNGGYNWINQYITASHYPDKIYMVNKNLGFIGRGYYGYTGRTTNGGFNWTLTSPDTSFYDMHFVDSLTGWRTGGANIKKTTDGGLTWQWQRLPQLNYANILSRFSLINYDTIYGVGGIYSYPFVDRGLVYKTINGGVNWGYQIPDTGYSIYQYRFISFANEIKGWAFPLAYKNIFTTTGGDSTIYTSIRKDGNQIAEDFILYQNFPNPFNQSTVISFQTSISGNVTLKLYDITGKEIRTLMNERKTSGSYNVRFDAGGLSSGVYFYKLSFNDVQFAIKKMIIIK